MSAIDQPTVVSPTAPSIQPADDRSGQFVATPHATEPLAVRQEEGNDGLSPLVDSPVLVSCVESAERTDTQHFQPIEVIEWMRTDTHFKLSDPIAAIRKTFGDKMTSSGNDRKIAKKAIYDAKTELPAVMWSGTFKIRKSGELITHSGLLCADLDDLGSAKIAEVRPKLESSPYVWAVFLSPSGDGLKCVFRVPADAAKHKASFHVVENHVRALTGVQIDRSCKDVGRLCFLSHDPHAYLNPDAEELLVLAETENPVKAAPIPIADKMLQARRKIAEELLGDIWDREGRTFCTCPGQDLHSTGAAETDCEVHLDGAPNIYCFHNSCQELVAEANRELQSRIGKAERITPVEWFNQRFPALSQRFGNALQLREDKNGDLYVSDIAEDFLAATLATESSPEAPTIFLPTEQKYYTYAPADGIYLHQRDPALLTKLSELLLDCARQSGGVNTEALKFRLRSSNKLGGVLKKAQSLLAAADDFFSTGLTEFLPCANGMLRLSDKTLLPFGPAFKRRNKLAVSFDAAAKCPLFLDVLMNPALDRDDLDLLQRWCGLALIGENLAQRFLILSGTAGGGKGTVIRVIVGIIGQANVATLRTRLLNERFELSRFLGKTLLYGADVQENFLNQTGSSVIKALTGGDPVTLEFKRSNESPSIICRFNAIVTCNSRLTVKLEGDTEAWRRRLAIINYEKPKPTKVIADLSERILANEASGVLNWMIEGLDKIRANGWQLTLTDAQQETVDNLLLESESHVIFAREALSPSKGEELTVEDCYTAYNHFCIARGWISHPRGEFSRLIGDVVARLYALPVRHDVKDLWHKDQRGWKGLQVAGVLDGD